ncbi:hypothetical protein DB346_02310 [Verrucomicrobia bacterium LW23]|nr:hypothetical protein DB346_02310 [Verrucomicrobia bacterium LW23]
MPLTPLTGRNTEVDLLTDRWELARDGFGQVVLLSGEAGLGKSRLVDTTRQLVFSDDNASAAPALRHDSADPGVPPAERGDARAPGAADPSGLLIEGLRSPVIEWRCSEQFQSTGLHPLADCLHRLLEFTSEDSPAARFDRLAAYLDACGMGRREVVALFAKLLFLPPDERFPSAGLSPVREREETFRAVREWLSACAAQRPLLFVVEDLHWIDASSLEFLSQLVGDGMRDRMLILMTFRPEFRVPWPHVPQQTTLVLNRFTRRQVAEVMRKSAGGALPDQLVAQIYQRTGGVPLLVEEFTRMVHESAIFDVTAGTEIPSTLQQLIMARLDKMSSNREVAHFAATLGREFQYDMLAAVVSVDEVTLQEELAKLAGAEILFSKGQPPRCAYHFKHALLEEALRNALEEAQRREFHQRVAETMEERFPLAATTQPELLALHFTEAGVLDKAVHYWLAAGRISLERFANEEAVRQLGRGLELLLKQPESPARNVLELSLLGPLGTAYIAARGYASPEVGPIFKRARTLAALGGNTIEAFVTLRGHFAYHIVHGDFVLCTELAAEAMRLAEEMDDEPGMLMEALFLKGLTHLYRGDFAEAQRCCSRALVELDDRERTAYWAAFTGEDSGVTHRCYLALAQWHLGFPEKAIATGREARRLADRLQHPFSLTYALHHIGWLNQHLRRGFEAQAAGEEEMQVAADQGFQFWHSTGTLYCGAGLLLRGRLEEGMRLFQKGLDAYRATGARLGLPYYLSILGDAQQRVGRYDDARRSFEDALKLVSESEERFQEAEIHRLRGELYLVAGEDEVSAQACFLRATRIARHQGSRAWELRATISLARLWYRQERKDEANMVLTTALSHYTEGHNTPDLRDAAALLKSWEHDKMRDEFAAGVKYVRECLPAPMTGPVAVDWRYIPSSTLGGDAIGYRWLTDVRLAIYLIDVTGHGLDSALLAVTITNVIRSGSLAGADLSRPEQVLAALNDAFQGSQHGYKFFTIWYGVYETSSRTLTWAGGGHHSSVILPPEPLNAAEKRQPLLLPSTGPLMGMMTGMTFTSSQVTVPRDARLFIFSDGVFEIRGIDSDTMWDIEGCIAYINQLDPGKGSAMDSLIAKARELRGSTQLEDDFSIIEARLE